MDGSTCRQRDLNNQYKPEGGITHLTQKRMSTVSRVCVNTSKYKQKRIGCYKDLLVGGVHA